MEAKGKTTKNNGVSGDGIFQKHSISDIAPPENPKMNNLAYASAILASMASILMGYDIGVMSGAAIFIQEDLKITDVQVEILVGILNLYSLIGSAAAGRTSDWIGRRYTMMLAAVIFFAGALVTGLASSYAFLMVGRFIAGIGVGYAIMIAPVYAAEVSPASSRGFLSSFPEVFINVGILLGNISSYGFSKLPEHLSWRLMTGIGGIFPIFLGIGVLLMPESPRWLVMQGRLRDARTVLIKTSNSNEDAELRLADIKEAAGIAKDCQDDIVAVPKRNQGGGVWKELLIRPTPSVRRVLIAAVGVHFFQQASGIDAVVLYVPRIFKSAGMSKKSNLLGATITIGLVGTMFTLVATFLLDKVGRRPLLLTSAGGMSVSLAGLGVVLSIINHSDKKLNWAIGLSITLILTNLAFFAIGMGPVAWVYSSEIFPLRLRAQGSGMGVAVNRLTSGVMSMTFISLTHAITTGGSFFLLAGITLAAWVFFYTFLPETQGKTLEEMDELFQNVKQSGGSVGDKQPGLDG